MSITEKDVNKLAELAKLDIEFNLEQHNAEFKSKLVDNLNNILHLVDQLQSIDTSKINPMIHADPLAKQILRPDLVTEINQRDLMQNIAPPHSVDSGLYLVPKVIENN